MSSTNMDGKRGTAAPERHPWLKGNFAPVRQTYSLTPCPYSGTIPSELFGGQYVRNGGNPVTDEVLGRDAHFFDGDGMLTGVAFKRKDNDQESVEPEFVNQYVVTDLLLSTLATPSLRNPIPPSVATLINPATSWLKLIWCAMRTTIIVMLSRLPGSEQTIKRISVGNTAILYHDGRALATCESGPPMRVTLPSLETVGWFNGKKAEGEPGEQPPGEVLGGEGMLSHMKEWTTAHPKVDPNTNEMMTFSSMFLPPYVHYSIIPATQKTRTASQLQPLLNLPIPGVSSAKMMHDFGVSQRHTVIMDLPLSLDPLQKLLRNRPPISYDITRPSRFGVFPRREPSLIRWFETSSCCIFHTVNTWDVLDNAGSVQAVDMLVCRMTAATVVFTAGNIPAPAPTRLTTQRVAQALPGKGHMPHSHVDDSHSVTLDSAHIPLLHEDSGPDQDSMIEDDACCLYYYSFHMGEKALNTITHQFALSAIPFEFASVKSNHLMSAARYAYGCSLSEGTFGAALGRNDRTDVIAKIDAQTLIVRGKANPPPSVTGCVDTRTVQDILQAPNVDRTVQLFLAPPRYYVQEPRFVPSSTASSEDDGFLLTYVYDEAQLTADGDLTPNTVSELWIIDAKGMKDILARVYLPQRVPYGLHGNWFSEREVLDQRPVESIRKLKRKEELHTEKSFTARISQRLTNALISVIGG